MSTSARTITTVRRSSAPRSVLLATRAHVDLHDKGLSSISGAQEIIAIIRARKTVTKLILGHNALGDEGTQELFRFLCSEEGRRYRIAEISLNSNGIGNAGLEAIADYLEGNEYLRELFLQNNAFQGNESSATKLSLAINSSKLELLSLASNQLLSDPFLIPFLSHLDSPSLRELQISATGLTRRSAPALIAFFCSSSSSPSRPCSRSRGVIEILKCNANALGTRAVRVFLAKLRTTNFTLQKLEVYANAAPADSHHHGSAARGGAELDGNGGSDDGENLLEEEGEEEREESVEEARAKWTKSEQGMKNMLVRNELLKRRVHEEALRLLTYSRALLLCSGSGQRNTSTSSSESSAQAHIPNASSSSGISQQTTDDTHDSSPSLPSSAPSHTLNNNNSTYFPFRNLPTELQQYILALLAPSLSASQRARIFAYAADPSTLSRPLFLPGVLLSNSPNSGAGAAGGCIPDPASLPFSSTVTGTGSPGSSPGMNGVGMAGIGLGLGPLSPSPSISQTLALSPNVDAGPRLGPGPGFSPSSPPSSPLLQSPPSPASQRSTSTSPSPSSPTSPTSSPSPSLSPSPTPFLGLCASGKCMGAGGSVLCHRAEIRMRWLADVGCTRFDPVPADGRGSGSGRVTEGEVLWLISQDR